MECGLCCRAYTASNGCICVVCARNSTYPLRIEQATALLEKETLGKHVEAILRGTEGSALRGSGVSLEPTISLGTSTGGTLIDRYESAKRIEFDRIMAETAAGRDRVQLISDKAAELRQEIEKLKKQRASKQAANAKKVAELSSSSHGLDERRRRERDRVRKHIAAFQTKWDNTHDKAANSRAYLCREAALLMGLKYAKKRNKEGQVMDVYSLASNKIWDLRDMHLAQPDPLSSSLANIATLLVRVSQYLAIRLPAEITIPHKDYPRPTIFSPSNSYLNRPVPYPGTTPSTSNTPSPSASRTLSDSTHLPRPRPLSIDRPLPQLIKEDPATYNLFLEGVCLLAWNIAWLNLAQRPSLTYASWQDLCPLGRNLFQLLITQQPPPPPAKQHNNPHAAAAAAAAVGGLGQRSHGSAHSFLDVVGSARAWRLPSVPRVVDQVKACLVAEMQGAEWEVLKEEEWTEMHAEVREEPVVVGSRARGAGGRSALSTISEAAVVVAAAASGRGDGLESAGEQGRARGVNGWMKLKSRNSGDGGASGG